MKIYLLRHTSLDVANDVSLWADRHLMFQILLKKVKQIKKIFLEKSTSKNQCFFLVKDLKDVLSVPYKTDNFRFYN